MSYRKMESIPSEWNAATRRAGATDLEAPPDTATGPRPCEPQQPRTSSRALIVPFRSRPQRALRLAEPRSFIVPPTLLAAILCALSALGRNFGDVFTLKRP